MRVMMRYWYLAMAREWRMSLYNPGGKPEGGQMVEAGWMSGVSDDVGSEILVVVAPRAKRTAWRSVGERRM